MNYDADVRMSSVVIPEVLIHWNLAGGVLADPRGGVSSGWVEHVHEASGALAFAAVTEKHTESRYSSCRKLEKNYVGCCTRKTYRITVFKL